MPKQTAQNNKNAPVGRSTRSSSKQPTLTTKKNTSASRRSKRLQSSPTKKRNAPARKKKTVKLTKKSSKASKKKTPANNNQEEIRPRTQEEMNEFFHWKKDKNGKFISRPGSNSAHTRIRKRKCFNSDAPTTFFCPHYPLCKQTLHNAHCAMFPKHRDNSHIIDFNMNRNEFKDKFKENLKKHKPNFAPSHASILCNLARQVHRHFEDDKCPGATKISDEEGYDLPEALIETKK